MLRSMGYHVSNTNDKIRDEGCCRNTFRYVQSVDVKEWTKLQLFKESYAESQSTCPVIIEKESFREGMVVVNSLCIGTPGNPQSLGFTWQSSPCRTAAAVCSHFVFSRSVACVSSSSLSRSHIFTKVAVGISIASGIGGIAIRMCQVRLTVPDTGAFILNT